MRRAAFFDLDKTLVPGSSLFLLARGMYARDFYRVRDIARLGIGQLRFRLAGENAGGLKQGREAALQFVTGRSQEEMRRMGREIAGERLLPRVYEGITQVIERHQQAGDLTFLATAAPQELAEMVAEALGMTGAIGTRAEVGPDGLYTGRLSGEIIHAEAKAHAVRDLAERMEIDLSESWAYSDSINDRPLLEAVGHPIAVNPEGELRHLARARGWPVHELRTKRLPLLIGIPSALGGSALFGAGVALGMWVGRRRNARATARERPPEQ